MKRVAWVCLFVIFLGIPAHAALITLPIVFVNGQVLSAPQLNSDFSTIYNDYNGNINNANISNTAGILLSKLQLNPGALAFNQQTTGNNTWAAGLTADSVPRITLTSDGWAGFGPGGSTAFDVYLKRSASLTLQLNSTSSTPTLDMNSGAIINCASITGLSTPLSVAQGGTGLGTLTTHNVLLGQGTSALHFAAPGTSGIPLVSQGASSDPAFSTAVVAGGGTGATTLTNHGVLLGQGTSAIAATSAGTSGQVLTSNGASSDPTFQAIPASGFGGNGADGAISNPVSNTGPIQKNATTWSLTGNNTYTLTNGPTIINCTSTFTLGDGSNASTITNTAGGGASGGAGGSSLNNATNLGSNGAGPGGGQNSASGANQANRGGGGGFGAAGGGGGIANTNSGSQCAGGAAYSLWNQGGSGGAGSNGTNTTGNAGGAGGNGGSAIIVCAAGAVSCLASSVINEKGSNGGNGTTLGGGGGGGSGGLVMFASQTSVTVAGTVNVSGGNGGNAVGTSAGGGGGGASGRIIVWSPSNSTGSGTFTMSGGSGGAHSGTATDGAAGGNGSLQSITGTPNLPLLTWVIKTPEGSKYLADLTNLEIACGRSKGHIVNISQRDLAWCAGKNIEGFCYYNVGDFQGSTCLGICDEVVNGGST